MLLAKELIDLIIIPTESNRLDFQKDIHICVLILIVMVTLIDIEALSIFVVEGLKFSSELNIDDFFVAVVSRWYLSRKTFYANQRDILVRRRQKSRERF